MAVFLYLIFFLSGAAGLISEVTLNRLFTPVTGNTVTAAGLIVMTFMAGLGLGSRWAGRFCHNRRPSLLPYIFIEVVLGIIVLLIPFFFPVLSRIHASAGNILPWSPALNLLGNALLCATLAGIPAFLMGATFPAVILIVSRQSPAQRVRHSGNLYGLNTLGAAAGCFIAGYFFLPYLGARATLVTAGLLHLSAAGGGLLLRAWNKDGLKPVPGEEEGERRIISGPSVPSVLDGASLSRESALRFLNVMTGVTGFISLAYQALMIRIIILLFGNHMEVFSTVVTAFLIAAGLSALTITEILKKIKNTAAVFVVTLLAAGLLTAYQAGFRAGSSTTPKAPSCNPMMAATMLPATTRHFAGEAVLPTILR